MRIAKPIIAGVLLSCVSVVDRDFIGRVVGISDGDIISVIHKGLGVKIRLYGVDAPEKGQTFGKEVQGEAKS